jgi:hypothetical protein
MGKNIPFLIYSLGVLLQNDKNQNNFVFNKCCDMVIRWMLLNRKVKAIKLKSLYDRLLRKTKFNRNIFSKYYNYLLFIIYYYHIKFKKL